MLVLTRRVGQSIDLPQSDISITVVGTKGQRARLGVSAPAHVPVHRGEVWQRIRAAEQPAAPCPASPAGRILLADSDPALVQRYRRCLEEAGFESITASDALACVARLRETAPDLLVLEWSLPWGGADGVLALMEEQTDVPAIPVIVLYREALAVEGAKQRRFGFCDFLRKPVNPEQFVDRVQASFSGGQCQRTMRLRSDAS